MRLWLARRISLRARVRRPRVVTPLITTAPESRVGVGAPPSKRDYRATHLNVYRERTVTPMGASEKFENTTQDLGGKAKEAAGKATDNERLEAEGKADQAGANLKQAGENVKDAFKN